MTRFLLVALVLMGACTRGPALFRRTPQPYPEMADSMYWKAVRHLDATNTKGSTDSALTFLDAYLAEGRIQKHRSEAATLRRLARDAQQLARVQAALQVARATSDTTKPRTDTPPRAAPRDEELVKEIQRLKDELAKANEELDRIRKRLAQPKPPS